jgi:hypothetical protein
MMFHRTLFKRFDIIIPVHTHAHPTFTASLVDGEDDDFPEPSRLSRPPSLTQQASSAHEDFYLVATLLSPIEKSLIPQYAAAGYVKLDRKFVLEKFVPPGLMQRIMAKTFFQFGTDPTAKHNPAPSSKNCWKNAFFQSFQSRTFSVIDIWVWLEEGEGLGGQVRIAGFGNMFVSQEVIAYMDRYSGAVCEILSTFPGLCYVNEVIMCPVCAMHQRTSDKCGVFTEREVKKIQHDLDDIASKTCGELPLARPRRQRGYSVSSAVSDISAAHAEEDDEHQVLSWRQLRARCSKNGCHVSADLLVRVPPVLIGKKTVSERSEQTIAFLLEEIVRLSAVPSAEVHHCICKIALCYTYTPNWEVFKANLAMRRAGGGPSLSRGQSGAEDMTTESGFVVEAGDVEELCKHLYTSMGPERASGVLASVPVNYTGEKAVVVLSCEHFMTDLETMIHVPNKPEGK